jgi:hypothetical protein
MPSLGVVQGIPQVRQLPAFMRETRDQPGQKRSLLDKHPELRRTSYPTTTATVYQLVLASRGRYIKVVSFFPSLLLPVSIVDCNSLGSLPREKGKQVLERLEHRQLLWPRLHRQSLPLRLKPGPSAHLTMSTDHHTHL